MLYLFWKLQLSFISLKDVQWCCYFSCKSRDAITFWKLQWSFISLKDVQWCCYFSLYICQFSTSFLDIFVSSYQEYFGAIFYPQWSPSDHSSNPTNHWAFCVYWRQMIYFIFFFFSFLVKWYDSLHMTNVSELDSARFVDIWACW